MDLLPVHMAVLTIADDAASADRSTANAIIERATSAGHSIVDEEIVRDDEEAIRNQLFRWIAQPDIDVVIVAAPLESEAASAALAPLIIQTLPEIAAQFRWLEAAQCESTFVFVLPAQERPARTAMDKAILPQLDVRTQPKNLVGMMPRLKDKAKPYLSAKPASKPSTPLIGGMPQVAPLQPTPISTPIPNPPQLPADDGWDDPVPETIVSEKTDAGPGVTPKLPARSKPRTANTIARKQDDPPTKEIDLRNLEKQIALSAANEAQTKQLDISGAPRTPSQPQPSQPHAQSAGVQTARTPSHPHTRDANARDASSHDPSTRVDLTANDQRTRVDLRPDDAKTRITAVPQTAHDAATKVGPAPTSRVLPRVPPGADASSADDTRESITFSTPTRGSSRTRALPVDMRGPAPIGVAKPRNESRATPVSGYPAARDSQSGMSARDSQSGSARNSQPGSARDSQAGISARDSQAGSSTRDSQWGSTSSADEGPTIRRSPHASTSSTHEEAPTTRANRPSGGPIPSVTAKSTSGPTEAPRRPSSPSYSGPNAAARPASPSHPPPSTARPGSPSQSGPNPVAPSSSGPNAAVPSTRPASPSRPPPAPVASAPTPMASPRTTPPSEPPQPPEIVEEMSGDELIEEVSAVKAMPEPASAEEPSLLDHETAAPIRSALFATAPAAPAAAAESPFAAPPKTDEGPNETAPTSFSALLAEPAKAKPAPSVDPLADLSARPLGVVDFPEGADFSYPIKKSGAALLLKIVLALAVLGGGFFAAMKFMEKKDSPQQTAAVAEEPKPEPPKPVEVSGSAEPKGEATPGSAAEVGSSAAGSAPDPTNTTDTTKTDATKTDATKTDATKIDATKTDVANAASTDATKTDATKTDASKATKTDATKTTKTADATKTKATDATKTTKTADATKTADTTKTTTKGTKTTKGEGTTETAGTEGAGDCDEVSCIMTKYDRACCDKYKPQDQFSPKTATPETLDKSMVKAGIETVKPRIVACGEQSGTKGTVKIAITVAGEGNVTNASVNESPDSSLGECVVAAIRKAKFRRTINGLEFVYPFVF